MFKRILPLLFTLLCAEAVFAQTETDAFFIKKIYNHALSESKAYDWLYHMSENIGGRLAGSPESLEAVKYTAHVLDSLGVDNQFNQTCMVNFWNRKTESTVKMWLSDNASVELSSTSLGNTVGTNNKTIRAEVVEVKNFDDLEKLGEDGIAGKIVFYNRPMDPTLINTFNAYGGAVDQRVYGASRAAKFGAVAALVRSMTNKIDDVPHTGTSIYENDPEVQAIIRNVTEQKSIGSGSSEEGSSNKIPSIAISTMAAELLSETLQSNPNLTVSLSNDNEIIKDVANYNVVGEWIGSEFPDEIIVVGGHIDSWDLGGGAHDDGAGCVQSMAVIEILKAMDYKPKHTIRCVLFANEENGLAGGREYARLAKENGEKHIAGIESDAGGFTPRAFSADGLPSFFDEKFRKVSDWFTLLEPYGVTLTKGGSGADISPLKDQGPLLFGLRPDSQRYFDFHHTAEDRIEAVNKRELNLGAAAMASLVYLIDQYGI